MLDNAMYPSVGLTIVILNVDLKLGSSMQGNARLAYVGWNFVDAMGTFSWREFVYTLL